MGFMIASLIITMASAAASAKAQYDAGKQQQKNAEYNAAIKEDQADEEQAVRAIESIEERNQSRRRLSSMEARYAKSGVLMAGTPELFMQSQAESDEFNILTRDRASSIRTSNFRTEADMLTAQGEGAYKAGKTGAFTSLLSGAASAASTGYNYQSKVGGRVKGGSLTNAPKMAASRNSSLYNNSNRMFA
jgi:hypothetical protein